MSSSTEILSEQSVYSFGENGSSDFNNTRSKNKICGEEVKSEINDLLFHVPEIKKHFSIHNKIGSGTFSCVFIASLRNHRELKEKFALKHILPTSLPSRIENELRCLMDIGGCDNVIGVKACMRHLDHVVIVMPHFAHDVFQEYFQELTLVEVRDYMKNLLIALRRVHKFKTIHRDVKPTNFLYNRKTKSYALVDFGLAHKVNQSPSVLDKNKTPQAEEDDTRVKEAATASDTHTPFGTDNKNHKRKADLLSPPEEKSSKCARYTRGSVDKNSKEADENVKSPKDSKSVDERELTKHKDIIKDFSIILDPKVSPVVLKTEESKALHEGRDPLLSRTRSPRRVLLTKQLQFSNKPESLQRRPLQSAKHGQRTALVIHRGGRPHYTTVAHKACKCFGQPSVCSVCMSRKHQVAPRAGTPGYRPPEVLMKCPDQTTAVDIWAAGVIFLSLLCHRHPFFKAGDDMTALAQILTIFGSDAMKVAARAFGKELTVSPTIPAVDLGTLVKKFRQQDHTAKTPKVSDKQDKKSNQNSDDISEETIDLLQRLLDLNPHTRITAEDALKHPYFSDS